MATIPPEKIPILMKNYYAGMATPPAFPDLLPRFTQKAPDKLVEGWVKGAAVAEMRTAVDQRAIVVPAPVERPTVPEYHVAAACSKAIDYGAKVDGDEPTNIFGHLQGWIRDFVGRREMGVEALANLTFEQLPLARHGGLDLDDNLPAGPSLPDKRLETFVRGVDEMLNHKYLITRRVSDNLAHGALNYPFILGLDAVLDDPSRVKNHAIVLIVGSKGHDIYRLDKARELARRELRFGGVDVVEPSDANAAACWEEMSRLKMPGEVHKMTFRQFADELLSRPRVAPYDLILFKDSLPHVLNEENADLWFCQFLARLLAPGGVAIFSHMDPGGAELLGSPDSNAISRDVTYLNYINPCARYPNGANVIRVGSSVFTDPVVDAGRMVEACALAGLIWDQIPGREVFKKYASYANYRMRNAEKQAEMRAVVYVEVRHGNSPFIQASMWKSKIAKEVDLEPVSSDTLGRLPTALRMAPPQLARGHLLTYHDSPFLRCAPYLVSLKLNGTVCIVYTTQGSAEAVVVVGGNQQYGKYFLRLPEAAPVDSLFQGEFFCTRGELPGASFDRGPLRGSIIVTEPIRFGDAAVSSFVARLLEARKWLCAHAFSVFGAKEWRPISLAAIEELLELQRQAPERADGLVFHETFCRPGMFVNQHGVYGGAHFFKTTPTVDLEVRGGRFVSTDVSLFVLSAGVHERLATLPDGVHEFTCHVPELQGPKVGKVCVMAWLRARPDKTRGNSLVELQTVAQSIPLTELVALVGHRYVYSAPVDIMQVAPNIWKLTVGGHEVDDSELEREFIAFGRTYGKCLSFALAPSVTPEPKQVALCIVRYASFMAQWFDPDSVSQAASAVMLDLAGAEAPAPASVVDVLAK